jgi:hypothetical protein
MGYVIWAPVNCMLSVELAKVENGWLWRSGMTGSMPGVGFHFYDRLVLENAKGRVGNIAAGGEHTAWCD